MAEMLGPYELGRVHHADCREALALLPAESVQCCVTSPPYWALRCYDVPETVWGGDVTCKHEFCPEVLRGGSKGGQGQNGQLADGAAAQGTRKRSTDSLGSTCCLCGGWRGQLGLEPTPDLYVSHLVGIFREVRRVLRDDGTLWLDVGDCYASSPCGNAPGDVSTSSLTNPERQDRVGRTRSTVAAGLKPKDLVGIPWLLAFALRADGWFLRAEIIWHKTVPMPESVRDRPTRSHEQVFLLSKSGTYFYDHDSASDEAINAGAVLKSSGSKFLSRGQAAGSGRKPSGNALKDAVTVAPRRNWRTVWTLGPDQNNAEHYAPFPRELARRCIVAGSKPGDVVLDPFAGTGTTVRVADGLGRKAIGFDLGEKYVAQANERSGEVRPSDAKPNQQVGLLAGLEAGGGKERAR